MHDQSIGTEDYTGREPAGDSGGFGSCQALNYGGGRFGRSETFVHFSRDNCAVNSSLFQKLTAAR
jgi:hypothetical protein